MLIRSSSDADKPARAFRGQSKSPNIGLPILPFDQALNPARPRKIRPPQPNYVPSRPTWADRAASERRRLRSDDRRRQCYQCATVLFYVKIHTVVWLCFRYLMWKFKTFM